MTVYKFQAGRLLCGKVRDFLKECQFRGMKIDFIESSGFFERNFILRGSSENLSSIKKSLEKWINENNLEG